MNLAELAAWIRKERQAQKITQEDMAFLLARHVHYISDIERMRPKDPGAFTLWRMANALGYELSFTVTRRSRI